MSQQELGWVALEQMKLTFFKLSFIAQSYNPFCVCLGQLSAAAILTQENFKCYWIVDVHLITFQEFQ